MHGIHGYNLEFGDRVGFFYGIAKVNAKSDIDHNFVKDDGRGSIFRSQASKRFFQDDFIDTVASMGQGVWSSTKLLHV